MTHRANFTVQACSTTGWKLVQYPNGNTATVIESTSPRWTDRAEAEAACQRVNAGDETGVQFASYADD
jgi:hypothetical protein